MSRTQRFLTGILAATLAGHASAQGPAADWTQWRGPNRDGSLSSFTAPRAWPEQLTRRWRVEVGPGYATPLVTGNRVYIFSRSGDNEVMRALDADSGKVLWQTGYPARFTMQSSATEHGPGPKSTPVLVDGRLYSIGMTGIVTAFDAASGKQLWQKPGSTNVPSFTTHSFSPIADRGLVYFHLGGHDDGAITAFTTAGQQRWTWTGDGPGYGSPVIADFAGTRQLVTITQDKVVGLDAASGALLWERPFAARISTNSLTPLVWGQTIVIANNAQPVTALAVSKQGTRWVTAPAWESHEAPMRMSNAVLSGDRLIGLSTRNSGMYFSIDMKTGKTLWSSPPRQGEFASLLLAGDTVLSLEDDGELVVFRSNAAGFQPLKRYQLADSETWTAPALVGNRLFVKDVTGLTLWMLN